MSYAHPDQSDIDAAKEILVQTIDNMDRTVERWENIRDDLQQLISEWSNNNQAIKDGNQAALTRLSIAIVSGAAAAASGGTLAPAIYIAYLGTLQAVQADSIDLSEYLTAMARLLSLHDSALDEVKKSWNGGTVEVPLLSTDFTIVRDSNNNIVPRTKEYIGYRVQYETYLTECASHISMDYKTLFREVQVRSGQIDSHTFEEPMSFHHYQTKPGAQGLYDWETWDLPADFECDGPCEDDFRTPAEAFSAHRKKCGNGDPVREILSFNEVPRPAPFKETLSELRSRSVEEGCGLSWYNCPSRPNAGANELHVERTCNKWVWEKPTGYLKAFKSYRCGREYRRCMGKIFDHNPDALGSSAHSDDADDSTEQQVISQEPVSTPITTNTIDGACGVHTGITASESSNHEWGTAPCGDDTHVGYLCQINNSGHEWVYESCPSSHAHYECDGSDHSLQASCTETNVNGDSCTVTSFYACQTHTHQYPALISGACGHTYTSSNSYNHRSETCPTNSNGDSCTSGSYYVCQSHTHQYPVRP